MAITIKSIWFIFWNIGGYSKETMKQCDFYPCFVPKRKCIVMVMFGVGQRENCVTYYSELKTVTLPQLHIHETRILGNFN